MTKDKRTLGAQMTNDEILMPKGSFVIRIWDFFRHSSFVIL
jgi:hypothetical protein